jgi:hypothetical protein
MSNLERNPPMLYNTIFAIGDKVHIDRAKDLVATVTSISIYGKAASYYTTYGIEWLHNGVNQGASAVPEYRLCLEGLVNDD